MNCKIPLLAILISISMPALADDQWVILASKDELHYEAKLGAFEIVTSNIGGDEIIVTGQIRDEKNQHTEIQRWRVMTTDCDKGFGDLVILKINGEHIVTADFVLDGASVASHVADGLCHFYKGVKEGRSKGESRS